MRFNRIFIFLVFSLFFIVSSLPAEIGMHKSDVLTLNNFISEGPEKLDELKALTEEIEDRLEDIEDRLEDIEKTKPIKTSKKGNVIFNNYEDDVVIYNSSKGKGVKLGDKEKLFFKDKGLSYTLEDKYYYSEYLVIDKKTKELIKLKWLSVDNYEYWENANAQYGFKKKDKDGAVVYKIYTVESGGDTLYKVTLKNKSGVYFSRKSASKIKYYTFLSDRGIKTRADSSIVYYISNRKKLGYYLNDNNELILLDRLSGRLYADKVPFSEQRSYVDELFKDFPNHRYVKYLKLLLDNRVPLRNSRAVMLFLINNARKSYNLSPLKSNKIINRVSRKHLSYIFANKPENLYVQEKGKRGFSGETAVERAKSGKYPNKLSEWIVRGNDPIKHFIEATDNDKLFSSFLYPGAIHFGHSSRFDKSGVKLLVSTIGIDEGSSDKSSDDIEGFVSKYRSEYKNAEMDELRELFWD